MPSATDRTLASTTKQIRQGLGADESSLAFSHHLLQLDLGTFAFRNYCCSKSRPNGRTLDLARYCCLFHAFLTHDRTFHVHPYFLILSTTVVPWHRSQGLVIPENIRLLFQPAHSPELNPVEHVWEEVREKHFYNRVFNSMDAVMDILCEGLQGLMRVSQKLRSMTYFPHLRLTC